MNRLINNFASRHFLHYLPVLVAVALSRYTTDITPAIKPWMGGRDILEIIVATYNTYTVFIRLVPGRTIRKRQKKLACARLFECATY